MADLGWFIFSTRGVVACLGLATLWVTLSRGSAASRRGLAALALFYLASSAEILPAALRQLVAAGYRPLTARDVPPGRTAVVLLGSGSYRFRDWSDRELVMVDPLGSMRLLEAARVFHLVNADLLISSGGLAVERDSNRPSGSSMADVLERLGVPHDRILVEDLSKNTHDEAVIVGGMLSTHQVDHVILVTSQFHMRRSVGAFRAAGLEVIPAVAREPEPLDRWWKNLLPTDKALDESAMAAHELAGLVIYAARGWYR